MSHEAFIALGSNLDNPRNQLTQALKAIETLPSTQLLQVSPFYETSPMGYENQQNFVNAVVLVATELVPLDLLSYLQAIERRQGRTREIKNGPRTIDCDLILYGNCVMNTPALTLPHPGICERDFVLRPLLDIAPDCTLPNGQALQHILNNLLVRYCEEGVRASLA